MNATADLILTGGTVYTLDPLGSTATAVAVRKGTILAVGSDVGITKLAAPGARRLNLAGAIVVPGLIDSHIHIPGVGNFSKMAFLYDARSIAEIVERMKAQAAKTTGAVGGRGGAFHETSLAEGRLPTAADLDKVATDRPVIVTDVNKTIVNSFVLRQINTEDVPPLGEVPKDASGKPLGIFLYAAKRLTPIIGPSDSVVTLPLEESIVVGLQSAARFGFTGVLDAGENAAGLRAFWNLAKDGRLPIRANTMPRLQVCSLAELEEMGITYGLREGLLTFGPMKLGYDRWVMHKTALMYEPYVGMPGHFGATGVSAEELQQNVHASFAAGWPVGIHTTGDRGIDVSAAAIEKGIEKAGKAPGRCHLIHVYFPTAKALDTAARHGMAIAAQPPFIRTWGETVRRFLGEKRAEPFTPLRSMLDHGLAVGGGADCTVTWLDPWVGIYAAVTRRTEGGYILGPSERISVAEALRCYTVGSATVLSQETVRGTIEVGKLADFAIIDRDILRIDAEQIPATRVLKTIVGGEVVYDAGR